MVLKNGKNGQNALSCFIRNNHDCNMENISSSSYLYKKNQDHSSNWTPINSLHFTKLRGFKIILAPKIKT